MKVGRPKGSKTSGPKRRRACVSDKLIGRKKGRWTILGKLTSRGKNTRLLVRCDCGTTGDRSYSTIYKSDSCGCLHSEIVIKNQSLPDNLGAKRKLMRNYKSSASKRDIEFNLTEDEFVKLITMNCYYCGATPSMELITGGGAIIHNGVDRVDTQKNYDYDNCVASCSNCNYIKGRATINIASKIMEFLNGKCK